MIVKEEDVERVSAVAAAVVADLFREKGWSVKGVEGTPSADQIASDIRDLIQTAVTPHRQFLPSVSRGQFKVEAMPDLEAVEVYLRIGTMRTGKYSHLNTPPQESA